MAVTKQRKAAPMAPGGRRRHEIPSHEHTHPPPRPRRRHSSKITPMPRALPTFLLLLFALASLLPRANAVFINFDNCLTPLTLEGDVPYLKFTPMYVWAAFDTHSPTHNLNVTVYGNVSGQTDTPALPPYTDLEAWNNPNDTRTLIGKIEDIDKVSNHYTTLFSDFRTLTYSSWTPKGVQFCANTLNDSQSDCPMKPAFNANASDPETLPGFTVSHDFHSTYAFSTWASELRIVSGIDRAYTLGCVSANITPDLGKRLSDTFRYFPVAVLILVGVATIFAATCSPWGSSNIFRWTSNYGRDEDLLRLVTPGFGDCLQYIQFVVLAGSLSLNYPGFFQPAISQASWTVLLFNESFVSKGNGSQSLDDGIYIVNGTYGLTRLGQYVGLTKERDMWACMAIFLLVLIAIVILLTQLGFLARWLVRMLTNNNDGDLTGKNWSFTVGHVVRIVFNYFMLPIIALSLFQLVVAPRSPGSVVGAAVVLLIGVMGSAFWIFWLIFTTRPRAHLFDDLPTVLTYGPLYNTYSDDAAPFAFIPVLLTIIRGIAIGAIQPSGIAQIIMLAICEVILILTLHAFRPFQSNTSMNAYHTFFSAVRLTCILLSVAFVPSLGVAESSKGWIGYAILLLHAVVLVFGFLLNALQTIVEVIARLSGAGADTRGGLTKVFGKRQLSKRANHRPQRSSLNSNAAMLAADEGKNIQLMDSRSRSMSASSGVLLNQPYDLDEHRRSGGFEFSEGNSPGTPGVNPMPFNFLGGGSGQSSRRPTMGPALDTADPYYRPPRVRTNTMDSAGPGTRGRGPQPPGSADIVDAPYSDQMDLEAGHDVGEGPSRASPAYLRMNRENDSDPNLERRNNTDYSVRESDFYYGLRGPALSSQPSRKLKTGPADPMSPVSSATGWFKSLNLLGGGRKKEKSKGFEVVRSTRMPPQMMAVAEQEEHEDEPSARAPKEPYRDDPDSPVSKKSQKSPSRTVAPAGVLAGERRRSHSSDSESDFSDEDAFVYDPTNRVSAIAPTLDPIETGGGIELPSRVGSRVSRSSTRGQKPGLASTPSIPRRSSRRTASTEAAILENNARLSRIMDSPSLPQGNQHLQPSGGTLPIRLPFGSSEPSPERSPGHSAASSVYRHALAPPPSIGGHGMVSTGFVQGHRTQDSFHSDGYDGADVETRAEIVERSRSGSTHMSGQSRRSRQL